MNEKPELLLHCCCAPCASYVIEYLIKQYNISLLFYNPNIEPYNEYEKRKNELYEYVRKASFSSHVNILNCEYDNEIFTDAVLALRKEPEGGKRCRVCYDLRLKKTAAAAAEGKYGFFATTLSVSPHKDACILNEIGIRLAEEYKISYLNEDFKKHDGYKRSVELSKQFALYRQNYCGCRERSNEN